MLRLPQSDWQCRLEILELKERLIAKAWVAFAPLRASRWRARFSLLRKFSNSIVQISLPPLGCGGCLNVRDWALQTGDSASWRRERDSNSRRTFILAGFQDRCNQPLCHPSAAREAGMLLQFVYQSTDFFAQSYSGCGLVISRKSLIL